MHCPAAASCSAAALGPVLAEKPKRHLFARSTREGKGASTNLTVPTVVTTFSDKFLIFSQISQEI